MKNEGRIFTTKAGNLRRKQYLDEMQGLQMNNVWEIPIINSQSKERTEYPTQKPLNLYTRIIDASSNEGDLILDPFCGCATTLLAAEIRKRKWVGIDIWDGSKKFVLLRMEKSHLVQPDENPGVLFSEDIHFTSKYPERTDEGLPAAPSLRVKVRVNEPEGVRMTRAEMYEHLIDQHGMKCQGCDRTFDDPRYLELDHNTPRSDGGYNHISNRVLLCGPCNRVKSNTYTLSGLRNINKKKGWMANKTTLF